MWKSISGEAMYDNGKIALVDVVIKKAERKQKPRRNNAGASAVRSLGQSPDAHVSSRTRSKLSLDTS